MPRQRERRQSTNNHRKKRVRSTQNEYWAGRGLSAHGWSTLQTFQACWGISIRSSFLFVQMTSLLLMFQHLAANNILPGIDLNAVELALQGSMAFYTSSVSMAIFWRQYDVILGDIDQYDDDPVDFGPDQKRQIQDLTPFQASPDF